MTKTSRLIELCCKEFSDNVIFCTPPTVITSLFTNPKIRKYTRYVELHVIFSLKLIYIRLRFSIQKVFLVDHSDAIHLFFMPKNRSISIVHDQFAYLASKNKIPGVKIGVLGKFYQFLTHQGLLRSQKLLPVSEHTKQVLIDQGVKLPMQVLYLTWSPWPVELVGISKFGCFPKKYALLVSPSSWRKNRIKAFNIIIELRKSSKLADLELIVVGEPMTKFENAFFNKSKIGFILFKQNVSETDLKKIYENALFCLVVSTYEGFGLPILEANSLGIRCLHNRLPSFVEITNSANIIIDDQIDSTDWAALSIMVSKFLPSPSLSIETANRFGYMEFSENLKNQFFL